MTPSRSAGSWLLLLLLAGGCSSAREEQRDPGAGALERARARELSGDLAGALKEYESLTQRGGSEVGLAALRRSAFLQAWLGQDSAALDSYRKLTAETLQARERELVELEIRALERIASLRAVVIRGEAEIDSLKAVQRLLVSGNAVQGKQIKDLEGQLKRVTEELRQLKEIDARLSGRHP
jgi:hypothetical protein